MILLAATCAAACGPSSGKVLEEPGGNGPTTVDATEEWIVFNSGRTGEGDIYGVAPDGRVLLLHGGPAPEGNVRFDPSRERIVYSRFADGRAATIPLRQPEASRVGSASPEPEARAEGPEVLFDAPEDRGAPSWSRSGEIVYAVEEGGSGHLVIADSLDRGPRRLAGDSSLERYPTWSPTGDRVAYAKRLDAGWDLHVLHVDSGEELRLTFDGVYVGHPSWSPDGSRLAFDRMVDDETEIFTLDLAGGRPRRLTDRAGMDLAPAWSGNGRRIVFGSDGGSGNWDLWTVDVETLATARLTSDPANDAGGIFVPASAIPTTEGQSRR